MWMFSWKALKEFCNDPAEHHAMWNGFCHAFRRSDNPYAPPEVWEEMTPEYHYYNTGRLTGHITQVAVVATIVFIGIRKLKDKKGGK